MKKETKEVIFGSKEWVTLWLIKQKTVHSWWYGWARVRLWKWFSVSSWKIAWDSQKVNTLVTYWPWTFRFTSEKVTFVSDEKSLTIKAKDLIDMQWYTNGIRLSDGKETYHFGYSDDWWEFFNSIAVQINPDAPLVHAQKKTESWFNIFKRYREIDKECHHRITMWIIFFLCLCYIKSL